MVDTSFIAGIDENVDRLLEVLGDPNLIDPGTQSLKTRCSFHLKIMVEHADNLRFEGKRTTEG